VTDDQSVEPVPVLASPAPVPSPETPGPSAVTMPPGTTPAAGAISERASDSDRDLVVQELRDHLVAGRLTLDEFSERTGAALAARTRGELGGVLSDLPAPSQPVAEIPRRRARRWIVAVMGETESKGRWRLSGHTAVMAVMGQCHIDLSRAEIDGSETVITAVAIMGQIDVVAPEGIDVEVTGLSLMGSRKVAMRDVPPLRGSPRIVVRAFPIMGEVNVRSRPSVADGPFRTKPLAPPLDP
jgi:hypothetical protein